MKCAFTSKSKEEATLAAMYGYYCKYDNLTALINTNFAGSSAEVLNIYIDANDILIHTYKFINQVYNEFESISTVAFCAGLVNMAAHYRNFFVTRYRVHTRIWIILSTDNVLAPKYYANFKPMILDIQNKEFNNKFISDVISLMKLLCNNINDVQFETCSVEFVTKMMSIREFNNNTYHDNAPSIVISKDAFALQACSYTDVLMLRPIKNKIGDSSYLANYLTATAYYCGEVSKSLSAVDYYCGNIPKPTVAQAYRINGELLSTLMAFTRIPNRGIKNKFTIPKAVNLILSVTGSMRTLAQYPWDFRRFLADIDRENKGVLKFDDMYELHCRFKAFDAAFMQTVAYNTMTEAKTYQGIVNLYDPEGMKRINEEHFKSCPLDLNAL